MQFTHLIDNGSGTSVQGSYSQSELCNRTVIRDETSNQYIVFNSQTEFEKWYMRQKDKHYHEIIFGFQNQRIKFDIDISDDIDGKLVVSCVLDTAIKVIKELFYCIDDIHLSKNDFIVTDSSGPTSKGFKHSYHIILFTYAVLNNYEAKYITDSVIKILPKEYRPYIDNSVNKTIQSFRLLYSTKCNSERTKVISNYFKTYQGTLLDTMIVPFHGIKVLSQLCEVETEYEENIDDILSKNIIKAIKSFNVLDGHKFRDAKNNTLNFDRVKPTHCTICDEIHHKDNSLVIMYDSISGGIYEYCRQSKRTRYICNIDKKEKTINFSKKKTDISCKFNDLSNKTEYEEEYMREYELVPTLAVKAQMKVGKTKALHKYVAKNFDNTKIIRFITFRQTFSNHVFNMFNDFELYSTIKGTISTNVKRVIIQVESLYRLQLDENNIIDLLILDEIESILNQLGSGLHKNFNASFAMFLWMLKTARHVVCMDANISDRTFNILSKFRKDPIYFHHNKWQSAKNDKFYFTIDKNVWLSQLCTKLKEGKRIVIPTNSIMEAKTCEMLIREMYPDKNIKMFSSELKHSEKQLYFNDVHKYWTELDVLIYTPTCSAGVSYELEHFDVLFGYFCNTSCDVETCRQMMHRVRNIKTGEYYIYLQELDMAKLPTTSEELHKYLYNKRTNMFQYVKDANLQYSYDIDGHIRFYETDYYFIWLENMSIGNLSKNDFSARFIGQVRETGASIKNMEAGDESITTEHCDARKMVEDKQNNDIASAVDLSPEEVEIILNKISNQIDIELCEYQAYEKHKLKKCYNFKGTVTPKFVEYYNHRNVQKVYRNLCDIACGSTVQESIELILRRENERYGSIVTNESKYKNKLEYSDLHNETTLYTSMSHIIVSKIMELVGNKSRKMDELKKLIETDIWTVLVKHENYLAVDLNIQLSSEKITVVNKLLKTMYGLRICKTKDTAKLKRCNIGELFTFSETPIDDTVTIITKNKLFLNL